MKILLRGEEQFSNCQAVYNEDMTSFEVKGELRGKQKCNGIEWHSKKDYHSLQILICLLGLTDYIEMELHEDMLYMRIIEE